MTVAANIAGQRFARLVAVCRSNLRSPRGVRLWECRCDCGHTKHASVNQLRRGMVKSCGCISAERRRHWVSTPALLLEWVPTDADRTRFWAKVNLIGPTVIPELGPCWIWTAFKNECGYGIFGLTKRNTSGAHRISWILSGQVLPPEAHVLHKCDNPACVNPEHLFLGTHQDNMEDMRSKGRASKKNRFPAHLRRDGEHNGAAKLSAEDVVKIRIMYAEGRVPCRELGDVFGVDELSIWRITRGLSWRNVGGPITPVVKAAPPRVYEHDGFIGTVSQWANRLGVDLSTLNKRLVRGAPPELVFSQQHIDPWDRRRQRQNESKQL